MNGMKNGGNLQFKIISTIKVPMQFSIGKLSVLLKKTLVYTDRKDHLELLHYTRYHKTNTFVTHNLLLKETFINILSR